MNLFKTAFLNIRKCSRDYSIYFFTLIIGVAIFYMFNSVGSQGFMGSLSASTSCATQSMVRIISSISVVVAVILGLLMVYANNFLIKRRKKEFGVYMMLGMGFKKVSRILSIETLLVGVFSLGIGLVAGIMGSQLLSIVVGKMFAVDLSSFRFVFSMKVLIKTVVYFAIIFLVVLVFNAKTLSKYELIDLLNAGKKAEKKLVKSPAVSTVIFILGIAALIFTYVEFGFRGNVLGKEEMVFSLFTGFFGTFAFFFGMAGFLPGFIKRFKSTYYNRLNSFVTAQFGHNLNSSAISLALISIMLFISIAAFSVGFSMNGYLNNRLENSTPVDVSAVFLHGTTSDMLRDKGYETGDVMADYVEVPVYASDWFVLRSPLNAAFDRAQNTFFNAKWDSPEDLVKLSDYNRLEAMYGREEIALEENEYAVISDFDMLNEIIDEAIEKGNVINAGDVALTSAYDECVYEYVVMSGTTAAMGVIVVPDSLIDNHPDEYTMVGTILSGNYSDAVGSEEDEIFEKCYAEYVDDSEAFYSTKTQVQESSVGTSVSVVFIVLYIGIIFIITGAAVIAMKILSDSMDSVDKYRILKRVGADSDMCRRALFTQTLFNFALPFGLGLIDSVFALNYAKGILNAFGLEKMFNGTVVAVCVMILVYGGYFLVTYTVSRRIVLEGNE